MKKYTLPIGLLFTVLSTTLLGAEVDQFSTKEIELTDSKEVLNAQINHYIAKSISQLNTREQCNEKELYKELQKYLENHLKGEIISFIKSQDSIEKHYLTPKESVFREWTMWDGFILARPGASRSSLAMSPLINVGGTYIGTDKIEHLFDRGFAYFQDHYKKQKSIEETLMDGMWWEKALYGGKKWGTGVVSYGDLAANFNGLRFWNDILGKNRDVLGSFTGPYIACQNRKWKQLKEIDITHYIDTSYDESINCPKFASERSARKVQNEIDALQVTACPIKGDAFKKLQQKYGPYAQFILNADGIEASETVRTLKEKFGMEFGWKKVPKEFSPLFNGRYNKLEYDSEKKYLRSFRYLDYSGESEETRLLSWERIKIDEHRVTPEVLRCWYIFLSGGDCHAPIPAPLPSAYTQNGTLDLLSHARDVSRTSGLVRAREMVLEEMAKRDSSHGEIKSKVIQTTQDKSLVIPDSFATISSERRARIGVYMVLGIGGDNSDNARLIRGAADEVARLGFKAEMLEVDPNLGSDYNAKLLDQIVKERLPQLDKVIFVAASKGASDFITYFLNYGPNLAPKERQKVELMVTLSGVIRPSFVADYLSRSNALTALAARNLLRAVGRKEMLKGIESLATNPWMGHDPTKLKELFPSLKWLSFPSVPEAKTALTNLSLWAGFLRSPVHNWTNIASPSDGLVESAAAILPPDTGLTEYIIPIHGPHEMALGSYAPGIRIAPEAQGDVYDQVIPAAGPEILSALFRALPRSLIKE